MFFQNQRISSKKYAYYLEIILACDHFYVLFIFGRCLL
ncbi:hypothetical Protein psc1_01360 [Candidatus Phytoplasma solani]